MTFQKIRDLREDHDLSQTDVGKVLHVSQRTYSHYECGDRVIPPDCLIRLAIYYHTSVDYLLGLTSNPKPYRRRRKKTTKHKWKWA